MLKKILIGLLVLLVVIQFIRPEKNSSATASTNDIATVYHVPDDVQQILANSCNDCHSNNTTYPWYTNIQPVGLWMQNHVNEGKSELNFSEFGAYNKKKQAHKMEEVVEMVEKGEMPLNSYLILHAGAKLSKEHAGILTKWADNLHQQIAAEAQ